MDRKLINPLIVTGIADAVRAKGKTTEPIKVADLPSAIMALPEGGGVGEDTSALLDAIGVESREDTGMANGLAVALTDSATEQMWSGERSVADGAPIKDGIAFVSALKGKTLKVNQMTPTFTEKEIKAEQFGVLGYWSKSVSNIISYSANEITFKTTQAGGMIYKTNFVVGHKYLAYCVVKSTDGNVGLRLMGVWDGISSGSTKVGVRSVIGTAYASESDCYISGRNANVTINCTRPQLIDLTDMGMEDVVDADDFAQRFGYASIEDMPYIPYQETNLQSFAPNAVVSKGRNLWDEEWENGVLNADGNPSRSYYYIIPKNYISVLPNSTICISFPEGLSARIYFYDRNKAFVSRTDALNKTKWITQIASGVYYIKFHYNVNTYNHNICINKSDSMDGTYTPYIAPSRLDFDLTTIVDAQGNQLFPDGELRSAGSVCDMVDYANNVAYKRIGGDEIHFSTMVAESDMWRVFLTGFSEAKSYGELNSLFGYTTKYSYNDVKNIDKTIAISSHGQYLLVHDSAITDVTAMRTKLSGVMLYYELAEPIIAPIGTTKAWYPVQNNGSEEAITDTIVPMNAEIRYRVDTESLLTQSASLLRYSNEVTGAENTSLGDAVKTLTDSYK